MAQKQEDQLLVLRATVVIITSLAVIVDTLMQLEWPSIAPAPLVLLAFLALAASAWLAALMRLRVPAGAVKPQRAGWHDFVFPLRQTWALVASTIQGNNPPEAVGGRKIPEEPGIDAQAAAASVCLLFAALCPAAFLMLALLDWDVLVHLHSAVALLVAAATLVASTVGYFFLTESRIGTGRLKPRAVARFGNVEKALAVAGELQATADEFVRGVWSFTKGPEVDRYFSGALVAGTKRSIHTIRIADLGLSDNVIAKHIEDNWSSLTNSDRLYELYVTIGLTFEMLLIDTKDALLFSHQEASGGITYQYDPMLAGGARQLFNDLLQRARLFDMAVPNTPFNRTAVNGWLNGARQELLKAL